MSNEYQMNEYQQVFSTLIFVCLFFVVVVVDWKLQLLCSISKFWNVVMILTSVTFIGN